ncbi:MAG: hypothetical protein DMF77_13610 [Acidobacteria bacterium]|nr:MAG: hypothetical protein DMF77_13610 [Acidobacteriota bacterium]
MADQPLRQLRPVPAGGFGGRTGAPPRDRAGRLLAQDPRTSELRRLLAGPGGGHAGDRAVRSRRSRDDRAVWNGRDGRARSPRRARRVAPPVHGRHHRRARARGRTREPRGSDTAQYFRREILRPFLDQYLKEGAPKADVAPVSAFETGTNTWHRLPAWPAGCASGCTIRPTPLHLAAGLKLTFAPPKAGDAAFDEYVSDPAKPVPFRARPNQPIGYDNGLTWPDWLVDDQREASGRPDVLVFTSDPLTAPVKISGTPVVNLVASTSGTDSDWVVKVIDVYPDEVAGQPAMGGYQLMVSADIFRGRYRQSLETPAAITAGEPLPYRFALPNANHVFRPGHRMMVQVQSSWFPLYDRNPQTFVPSIFWAQPQDYRKATQRIYHAPGQASFVELPIVERQ